MRVPRRGARPARTARGQVRFAPVVLTAPKGSQLPPVRVWAVYAREVGHGAAVTDPIEWMLLTTVETHNFEQARERLAWYSRR